MFNNLFLTNCCENRKIVKQDFFIQFNSFYLHTSSLLVIMEHPIYRIEYLLLQLTLARRNLVYKFSSVYIFNPIIYILHLYSLSISNSIYFIHFILSFLILSSFYLILSSHTHLIFTYNTLYSHCHILSILFIHSIYDILLQFLIAFYCNLLQFIIVYFVIVIMTQLHLLSLLLKAFLLSLYHFLFINFL